MPEPPPRTPRIDKLATLWQAVINPQDQNQNGNGAYQFDINAVNRFGARRLDKAGKATKSPRQIEIQIAVTDRPIV
jgi:hypothetical protein